MDLIFYSLNYSIVLLETIITGYALNTKTDMNYLTKEVYNHSSAMISLSSWKSFQKVFGRCKVRKIYLRLITYLSKVVLHMNVKKREML